MVEGTRARMVTAAEQLFRERGYDGTGFREVVERAGTARGVIYHHFPHGKTELGVEVATAAADRIGSRVEELCRTADATTAVTLMLDTMERWLVRGEPRPGCPIMAVTLAADDATEELRAAGAGFYARLRTAVRDCLARDGVPRREATAYAALVLASCEGAVVLCRAERSSAPFRLVRESLLAHLAALLPPGPARAGG